MPELEYASNFIKTRMEQDLAEGRVKEIVTRFPPEPNAYLHIGHVRAIITDFELAKEFNGYTNLRFDDTNPAKEGAEYVDAIQKDIEWLGYKAKNVYFGSDYFDRTYELARKLIKDGLAYVDDLTPEQVTEYRGELDKPGKNSPYRDRSVEENLKLFEEMKEGKYADGTKTLRAKIDMASPNINMRDPVMYRILHMAHHRQGNKWCIYPMYDFAHPLQDSFEGVTHSLCSLEYDNHRPLYDWVIEKTGVSHIPHQIEFGRLNITNTIMSKRYLRSLVENGKVIGYDDPRMPTLVGLKRRGFTPESIKAFVMSTGLSRVNSTVDVGMLDECLRENLKLKVNRYMAVTNPLKVTITNWPKGEVVELDAANNGENPELGSRKIKFSGSLYINQDDFCEVAPDKKYKRLALGLEVRLFYAYFIKAESVIKDEAGNVIEVLATYDPETKGGNGPRKPNGTISWVDAVYNKPATFNQFEALITDPDETKDITERVNPDSWKTLKGFIEPLDYAPQDRFQMMRDGYYCVDYDSKNDTPIFNRIVSLKSAIKK